MPLVKANGIEMQYRESGSGSRSVLFVHALGASLRIWDEVAERLPSGLRCIRYDLRGHGGTAVTEGAYSIELLAADLLGLMDALGLREAVVCGVSIGGLIAQRAALDAPERIRALVLCDTGAKIGSAAGWQDRIRLVNDSGLPQAASLITPRWFGTDFRANQAPLADALQADLAAMSAAGYIGACHALRDADLSSQVGKIDVPVLIACGEEDVATPPAVARELAALIPGARVEIIAQAGHLPCVETPERLAPLIDTFLQEAKVG